MPGKEIKGRSKIANYRHGGRTGKQFGGPLTQPLVRPGVGQPGVGQPGVGQPGVGQPGVMPTRPLGLKDGGRTGFKEGMGAAKKRKKPSSPSPSPDKILKKPSSPHLDEPKSPEPPKGGRRPGPSKGPSPKTKPKVEEDWAAKGGRIGFKKGTNKKNGPVRPIDLPFPTPENPVPSKKKKK